MHCYYHLSIILEYFEWSFDAGRLHAGGASVVHGPALEEPGPTFGLRLGFGLAWAGACHSSTSPSVEKKSYHHTA